MTEPNGHTRDLARRVAPDERDEHRAAQEFAERPPSRGWRETLREARNWRELRQTPYGLKPVSILVWAAFFFSFNNVVGGIAFRQILRDIDMDFETWLRYDGFISFVGLFASLGIAFYADRRKRLPMVGIGFIIASIFTGITSGAQSGLSYGLPQAISQAWFIVALVPVTSLLADYYPPTSRGKVFALVGLASAGTSVVVPALAGEAVQRFGWRPIYLITSIPVAVLGILILVRLREPIRGYMERRELGLSDDESRVEEESPSFGEAFRTVLGIRTLRRLFVAGLFGAAGATIFGRLFRAFLFQEYGLSEREIGWVYALAALVVFPAFYMAGGVVDSMLKRGGRRLLTYVGLVELVGLIPLVFIIFRAPLWLVIGFNSIFVFIDAMLGPAIAVLFVNILPAHVRNLGDSVRGLAAVTAPVGLFLTGALVSSYGLDGGMAFSLPLLVVSAIVFITAAPLYELDMRSAMAANVASNEWKKAQRRGQGKLLVCRDVDVEYDGVQVLFGVDFDVEEGQIIALLGTNGAGKSTLLKAIAGAKPASSGAVVFDGRDVTYMPPHELARRGVVLMPGGRGVFPALTVRENLLLGTWMLEGNAEKSERLAEVFEIFPSLAARADAPASALSGGEQQMLSLAQAFLAKPRLLMIDELSLGLSPAVVGELLETVKRIHETGVTVIVVEQSVNVALNLAEKAIFMEKGEVKFFGETADLLARPDILRAVYVKGTGALTDGAPAGAQRSSREQRRHDLATARPILELTELTKRFGGVTAVDGVSFTVPEGLVLGVVGPNGSGKTTLFELISGFQDPDAGRVVYDGVDVTSLGPDERARRGIVRRFQDARLVPSLTVFETLLVALDQSLDVRSTFLGAAGLPQARRAERRARQRAERLIELLELGGYRDKFVKELSTGLRRIVDLACVLATSPKLLLLDEPSSGIAQAEAESLAPLLGRVRFETGCTILIIEHDMPLLSSVADELIALDRGAFVVRGRPDEVLNDERVVEAYLGGDEAAIRRSGSLT